MGDRTWTFRGDGELDPILAKWSKISEKSFHVRQALRQYINGGIPYLHNEISYESSPENEQLEVELSLSEWG